MAMEGTVQSIEVSAPPQHVYEVALDLVSLPPSQLEPRLKKLLGWAA